MNKILIDLPFEEKNKLGSQLDDMFNSLVIEHGVVTTDYSH